MGYSNSTYRRFLESSFEIPGHVVDKDGMKTDPGKVCEIQSYPRPQNIAQLRTFLGMAGYCRKLILRYAQMATPLYELISAKNKFVCGDKQEEFVNLKEALVGAPVLEQPNIEKARNRSRHFIIYTDASRMWHFNNSM